MNRRASPRARTIRTAPTVPCIPVDRGGAPVPRSYAPGSGPVTGEIGSCTSVEGGSERSTGSPGTAPNRRRRSAGRSDRRWPWRPASPWPSPRSACTSSPTSIASTTTSCGRRRRSSRARRPSATRSRRRPSGSATGSSRTCCPSGAIDGVDARPDPVPAAAGVAARAVRRGVRPRRRRPAAVHGARGGRRRDLLVDDRPAARVGRRAGPDDPVLRIRDRLLVHGPERDDLVPGPHRRGRADDARGRAGARDRRIARAAGRTTRRSTVAASRSGCCSGSRRPPA